MNVSQGPPWQIEGEQGASVMVAAPADFAPGAEFEVPTNHRAVIVAFELKNEGKSPYYPTGFTTTLASSDPCEGFAYLSQGVTGVPEVVDSGKSADFTYGFFCKGKTGERLTLKVGLDPNSPIARIKTEIP